MGLLLLAVLVMTPLLAACPNIFDPLDTSDEIRGLSYVDFSLTWDRWDSDPEFDGVVLSIQYFNEFGDSLDFRDKPHQIVLEFYTQQLVGAEVDPVTMEESGGLPSFDELFFTYPVEFENSDDDIRIPIESYEEALLGAGYTLEEDATAFVNLRVFPPKQMPQPELLVFFSDVVVFQPEPTAATDEELLDGEGEPPPPAP